MRTRAAALCAAAVAAAAIWPAVARWRVRAANAGLEIPVLMYHNVVDGGDITVWQVSAEEFGRQMAELAAAGYESILPDDIAMAASGRRVLPRRPVAITFDDGYEGVAKCAEPILAAHGFRAICYVIAGKVGGEGDRRGVFDSGALLSSNEVAALARRGIISVGSHSMTHTPHAAVQAAEIPESRSALRRMAGTAVASYCYPHGNHCGHLLDGALESAGYTTAMACDDRIFRLDANADLFAIPRVSVYGGLHDFKVEAAAIDGNKATAEVRNGGMAMPVRCLLRERGARRAFPSDGGPVRIGVGRKSKGERAVFSWSSLPDDICRDGLEVVVAEQNGLFTYGEPFAVR